AGAGRADENVGAVVLVDVPCQLERGAEVGVVPPAVDHVDERHVFAGVDPDGSSPRDDRAVGKLDVVVRRAHGEVDEAVSIDVAGAGDGVAEEVAVVRAREGRGNLAVCAADDVRLTGDGQLRLSAAGRADDDLAEVVAVHVAQGGD